MYGPTETTVWSTVEKVVVDETDKTGYVNLGKPIDNTLIYVLNQEFQPVPVGYPGELFIGGDGLAKGYFNLPEMTREKFLPDTFSGIKGARMYRTGDLVQQTENGKLEFLNRVDSQVKIRGFRIELGEIESALSQYKTVRDNVVIVREDIPGDKRLIAYIIGKDKQETDISGLRQFLRTKVPDYMVPSSFVFISQFPLTPNGKIDRKMLPPPEDQARETTKVYLEPSTELEIKLAQIWCDVLKIKRIGTDENFFEIGGHSMIAVTLMIKIEKELGTRLPLATLFDHSNIRDMANFLEQKLEPARWGSLVPIRAKGSKRPLYLVHGAGLNLLLYTTIVSHLDPDQPVYGLQAKGLDGVDEPLDTIEGIAAYYISEILAFDNKGTYALAGFSMGGQIAYEMARQLVLMDKKVSFLGVFDTVSYNISDRHLPVIERYTRRIDRIYNQVTWTCGTFMKKPGRKKFEFLVSKWQSIVKRITKDDYKIKPEGVSAGNKSELPKYLHKVHRANYEALEKYILPPYPGKLHLFRALNQSFYIKDPVLYGWDEFVGGGVEVLDIPGEHSRIFAPPNDKIFADALQKCLNETNIN
jgi:thioesterase domain-containing protein/acyl carrier protein